MKINFALLCILLILNVNGYKCDGVKDWFKNKIGKITGHKHDNHNDHHTGHNHHDGEDKHKNTLGGHVDRLINKFNPLKFLESNGYSLGKASRQKLLTSPLLAKSSIQSLPKDDTDLKDMVKLFQRLHHLNVSGDLDPQTVSKMSSPRCGFPDIPIDNLAPRVSAFKAYQIKWNKTDLRYKFVKYNIELGEKATKLAIHQAFNYWAQHSELNFKEVCQICESELTIDFNEEDHKDGNPFDGKSGVLAHAYFPKDGRIHFDEAEEFTEGTTNGINLRIVAAHEIGHALGLEHSFVKQSLMYPYYGGYIENFTLPEDDQLGISSLYGNRKSPAGPSTTATTTSASTKTSLKPTLITAGKQTTTTKKLVTTQKTSTQSDVNNPKNILPCNTPSEVVFTSPRNNIWVLIDHDDLWLYNLTGRNWNRFTLYEAFPKIESAVRGGVKCSRNYTWFFKGKKVWAYNNYDLVTGFPKMITDPMFPSNPWTAVNKNGRVYVLKGSFAYEFDTVTLRVVGNHPDYVKKVFPGLPDWVESAVKYNDQHYMFKDKWVYKFDESINKVHEGYPRIKYDAWFPCYRSTFQALSLADTRKL